MEINFGTILKQRKMNKGRNMGAFVIWILLSFGHKKNNCCNGVKRRLKLSFQAAANDKTADDPTKKKVDTLRS